MGRDEIAIETFWAFLRRTELERSGRIRLDAGKDRVALVVSWLARVS